MTVIINPFRYCRLLMLMRELIFGAVNDRNSLIACNKGDKWTVKTLIAVKEWIEINLGQRKHVKKINTFWDFINNSGVPRLLGRAKKYSAWKKTEVLTRHSEEPESHSLNFVTFENNI